MAPFQRLHARNAMWSMLLLLLTLGLLLTSESAEAFPYGKTSAVMELTPSTINAFLRTHKPVYLLLYAPWCGHCQRIRPQWESFAEAMQGTVQVGAVNADEHKSLGQRFSVQGFPTIKYWKLGNKSSSGAMDYNGERSSAALRSHAVDQVKPTRVTVVRDMSGLTKAVADSPQGQVAFLVSQKKSPPPVFSVLAFSAKLQELPFVFFSVAGGGILPDGLGIEKVPTVAIVQRNVDSGELEALPYSGAFTYKPMAMFFIDAVNGTTGDEAATAAANGAQESQGGEGGERKTAKSAFPVRPVVWSADAILQYCSPNAQKVRHQVPMCVLSFTSSISLEALHSRYAQDALVFVSVEEEEAKEQLTSMLRTEFGMEVDDGGTGNEFPAGLIFRQTKATAVKYKWLSASMSTDDVAVLLDKVVTGDVPLQHFRVGA